MKPAPFEYHRPSSLDEALALKHEHGAEARILAGGQSLMPMMRFRLATPSHLIDLNGLSELDYVRRANGHLSIGAATRQQAVLDSADAAAAAPLLVDAMRHIGHAQIRHRGTVVGSIAHADPSAEIPAVLLTVGGSVVARSPDGERVIAAADMFTGPFATAVADDEILTEARVEAWPEGSGFAWIELCRVYNGFPVVGVGAAVQMEDGTVARAALGMCGVAASAIAAPVDGLIGAEPTAETIDAAAEAAVAGLDPPADVHGSGPYRIGVGRACVRRALSAATRAAGAAA